MKLIVGILVVAYAFAAGMVVTQAVEQKGLSMIKTVPTAATLEYRVKGQLLQSLDITPGTYEISIKQLH